MIFNGRSRQVDISFPSNFHTPTESPASSETLSFIHSFIHSFLEEKTHFTRILTPVHRISNPLPHGTTPSPHKDTYSPNLAQSGPSPQGMPASIHSQPRIFALNPPHETSTPLFNPPSPRARSNQVPELLGGAPSHVRG